MNRTNEWIKTLNLEDAKQTADLIASLHAQLEAAQARVSELEAEKARWDGNDFLSATCIGLLNGELVSSLDKNDVLKEALEFAALELESSAEVHKCEVCRNASIYIDGILENNK